MLKKLHVVQKSQLEVQLGDDQAVVAPHREVWSRKCSN